MHRRDADRRPTRSRLSAPRNHSRKDSNRLTARAETIAEALVAPGALHSRVHPVFLPLSVRQNRIEDVFFDFLRWLRPQNEREAAEPAEDRTADKRAELIVARLREASD